MVFTLGFNPTMKVSMGIALPLFAESEGELVDIEIYGHIVFLSRDAVKCSALA